MRRRDRMEMFVVGALLLVLAGFILGNTARAEQVRLERQEVLFLVSDHLGEQGAGFFDVVSAPQTIMCLLDYPVPATPTAVPCLAASGVYPSGLVRVVPVVGLFLPRGRVE